MKKDEPLEMKWGKKDVQNVKKMRERMREERLNSISPENLKQLTKHSTDSDLEKMNSNMKGFHFPIAA